MRLIINADDFGLSPSINRGIVECFDAGLITSTTIMMNTPYTNEAIELAKAHNIHNIGIHLNLTYGQSVLPREQIPSLVDNRGVFHYVCMLGYYTQYLDAKKELRAQIEKFLATGLTPTHIDHHHYFHEVPNILKAYLELAQEYNLPIRAMTSEVRRQAKIYGLKTTNAFSFDFHNSGVDLSTLVLLHQHFKDDDITLELLTHPGYIDQYTTNQTGYLIREEEMNILRTAKDNGLWNDVDLISFRDL